MKFYILLIVVGVVAYSCDAKRKRKFEGDFEFAEEDETRSTKPGEKKRWIHDPSTEDSLNWKEYKINAKYLCIKKDVYPHKFIQTVSDVPKTFSQLSELAQKNRLEYMEEFEKKFASSITASDHQNAINLSISLEQSPALMEFVDCASSPPMTTRDKAPTIATYEMRKDVIHEEEQVKNIKKPHKVVASITKTICKTQSRISEPPSSTLKSMNRKRVTLIDTSDASLIKSKRIIMSSNSPSDRHSTISENRGDPLESPPCRNKGAAMPSRNPSVQAMRVADEIKTSEMSIVCPICKMKFARMQSLKAHLIKHTGQNRFVNISPTSELNNHLKLLHTDEKRIAKIINTQCIDKFALKDNSNGHLKFRIVKTIFACKLCNIKFMNKEVLELHLQLHATNKICKLRSGRTVLRKVLLRKNADGTVDECEIRNKAIIQKASLKTDLPLNAVEKSFECEICQKKFRFKHNLQLHLQLHSTNSLKKSKTCETSDLNDHLNLQTNDKSLKVNSECKSPDGDICDQNGSVHSGEHSSKLDLLHEEVDINLKDPLGDICHQKDSIHSEEHSSKLELLHGEVDLNLKDSSGDICHQNGSIHSKEHSNKLELLHGEVDINLKNPLGDICHQKDSIHSEEHSSKLELLHGEVDLNLKDSSGDICHQNGSIHSKEHSNKLELLHGEVDINLKDPLGDISDKKDSIHAAKHSSELKLLHKEVDIKLEDPLGDICDQTGSIHSEEELLHGEVDINLKDTLGDICDRKDSINAAKHSSELTLLHGIVDIKLEDPLGDISDQTGSIHSGEYSSKFELLHGGVNIKLEDPLADICDQNGSIHSAEHSSELELLHGGVNIKLEDITEEENLNAYLILHTDDESFVFEVNSKNKLKVIH